MRRSKWWLCLVFLPCCVWAQDQIPQTAQADRLQASVDSVRRYGHLADPVALTDFPVPANFRHVQENVISDPDGALSPFWQKLAESQTDAKTDSVRIVHVGDSRIYELTNEFKKLTKDQTFVAREVAMGRMTEEQAKVDPRRSVLLQCVGASSVVQPDFIKGEVKDNAVYLLCSDGFRHQISEEEIMDKLGPDATSSSEELQYGCVYLTELVKNRKETDNISVVVVKTF